MKKLILLLLLLLIPVSIACATPTVLTVGDTTVSWDAPTTNADGSTLTDGAGYWLYFASVSKGQSNLQRYEITDWSQTSVLFIDIPTITTTDIFLRVTAYDTSGNESDWSNEAVREFGNAGEVPGGSSNLMSQE